MRGSHTRSILRHLGGVPVLGDMPIAIGSASNGSEVEYYFVDGTNGSDGNTGLRADQAKATIAAAVTLANAQISWSVTRWASLAVIIVAPGLYAENLTALPYGATILGLGDCFDLNGQNGVTVKPASGSPLDATSVINCHIHNICFESPDMAPCFETDNFNRNVVTHCLFAGNTSDTTTNCFEVVKDMTGNRITDCIFHRGAYGMYIDTDNANSKQASGNIIEHCYVTGCTTAGIYFEVNTVPSFTVLNHCVVGDGSTTLALGLDDDTSSVGVNWCTFQATANDPATADGGKYNGCYLNGVLLTQS